MKIVTIFLKSNLTGIITFSELNWITTNQSNFTRLEESIAIKIGRMLDEGSINIGCHLNYWLILLIKHQKEKNLFLGKELII